MRPHTTMAIAKLINTMENDPPAKEIKAPNEIGVIKPPSVPPVLTIPIDEPITFSGKILCGQEKIPTNIVVSKKVNTYKNTMDSAKESEITNPKNNTDDRIEQTIKSNFSFPLNFVNNTPANKDASAPPIAFTARMVPTVLIDSENFTFKKDGIQDMFP